MERLISIIVCLLLAIPCTAEIITVDDDGLADFNSIQSAINFANDGDIIIVQPGLYNEDINFLGKDVVLASTNPANPIVVTSTILGYNGGHLVFRGTEDPNCALIGFVVNSEIVGFDWSIDPNGENHTHATISNCIFQSNKETCGTVIYACDGAITNCLIADNNLRICACICPPIVACHGLIKNCTIANSTTGVAIEVIDNGITTVQNCIIYDENQSIWPQIMVDK